MKASGCVFNALTVFFIALSIVACVWTGAVFMNPQGAFNPLKPPILDAADATPDPATVGTPTDEITFPTLPPEWTATPSPRPVTATPSDTLTPEPSETPEPTDTLVASPVGPTATQSETPQPTRTPSRTAPPPPPTADPGAYPASPVPTTAAPTAYP